MPRIESFKGDVSKLTSSAVLVDNLEEAILVWGAVHEPFSKEQKEHAYSLAKNTNFNSLSSKIGEKRVSRFNRETFRHFGEEELGDFYWPTLLGLSWNPKVISGVFTLGSIFGSGYSLEKVFTMMPLGVRALVTFTTNSKGSFPKEILGRAHKIPYAVQRVIAEVGWRNSALEAVIEYPDLNPKLMIQIAENTFGEEAKILLALRGDIPKQALRKLVHDKSSAVREQVAARLDLPDSFWELLARDQDYRVLKAVAQNLTAPEHLRVWAALAANPPQF